MDKTCGSLLQKICQKYDNLDEVDKLASVTKKVDTVKLVMQENVDLALQNCVKLETIERAAGEMPTRLESHTQHLLIESLLLFQQRNSRTRQVCLSAMPMS